MRKLLLAFLLTLFAFPAHGQGCGQGNPNCVAPTPPASDNSNRIANTAWVRANGGGGGAVASVSNADGTLTITPTTGAVVASLNLGHANTWSAAQTFAAITATGTLTTNVTGSTQCLQVNSSGAVTGTGASCGGSSAVTSVSNADGTLTISPTTGAVVASLALGHANTWTALQTFGAITLTGTLTTNVTGSAQCLQVNTSGVVSGFGAGCGGGGGGAVNSVSNADGTLTISPTTGAVVASIALAHANTWTGAQTHNAGDQSLVGTRSGKSFANDSPPANALRWKDKIFVGDAAANFGNNGVPSLGGSCPSPDWFTTFYGTTQEGSCAYTYGFQLVVETDASLLYNSGAIMGAAQSKNVGHNQGSLGLTGFCLNNSTAIGTINFGCWAGYLECDQTVSNNTGCFGLEIDVANTISDGYAGNPDPYTGTIFAGVHSACGSGFGAFPTVFKCGAAYQITDNGNQWKVGINFLKGGSFASGSIAAQTIFGGAVSPALAFPPLYGLIWYSAAANPVGGLEWDAAGNLQLGFNGGSNSIVINGVGGSGSGVGQNCSGPPSPSFQTLKGLVIAC